MIDDILDRIFSITLLESREVAYKKYVDTGTISPQIFNELLALDPTEGKYIEWLCLNYVRDRYELTNNIVDTELKQYYDLIKSKKIQGKDTNIFNLKPKDIPKLIYHSFVAQMLNAREKQFVENDEARVVLDNEYCIVVIMVTQDAMSYFGRDSSWCVANHDKEPDSWWNKYASECVLYLIISKIDFESNKGNAKAGDRFLYANSPKYILCDLENSEVSNSESFLKHLHIPYSIVQDNAYDIYGDIDTETDDEKWERVREAYDNASWSNFDKEWVLYIDDSNKNFWDYLIDIDYFQRNVDKIKDDTYQHFLDHADGPQDFNDDEGMYIDKSDIDEYLTKKGILSEEPVEREKIDAEEEKLNRMRTQDLPLQKRFGTKWGGAQGNEPAYTLENESIINSVLDRINY